MRSRPGVPPLSAASLTRFASDGAGVRRDHSPDQGVGMGRQLLRRGRGRRPGARGRVDDDDVLAPFERDHPVGLLEQAEAVSELPADIEQAAIEMQ